MNAIRTAFTSLVFLWLLAWCFAMAALIVGK